MKNKNIQWKKLISALAIPLAAGGLSAFLSREGMQGFEGVYKPILTPPAWVFPVVWTVLYIFMGLAYYRVSISDVIGDRKKRALTAYGLQLFANFLWSIIFFRLELWTAAFIWLIILYVLAIICTVRFYHIDESAGRLMIPYLIWLFAAAYLNLGVCILN